MKCQKCNINEATIVVRQTVNGKEYEHKICGSCAKELGFSNKFSLNPDLILGNVFFAPVIFPKYNLSGNTEMIGHIDKKNEVCCRNCKSTLEDIRKTGRVGCSKCYDAFEDQLIEIFRRIQSGETHRGRIICQTAAQLMIRNLNDEISSLNEQIREAVLIEDYESAAKYKSQILKHKASIEKAGKENTSDNTVDTKQKKNPQSKKTDKGGE